MKVILASQGFNTKEIAESIASIVGKPLQDINIAIISEPLYDLSADADKRWIIKELSNIDKYIGGKIDFVSLRYHSKEEILARLLSADLTYLVGGKLHIYEKLVNELNLQDIITKVANERAIMGTSVGSVFLGRQIESHKFWKQRYNINYEDIKYHTLGLVPFTISPHYLREDHKKWTKKFYLDVFKDNPFPIYAIKDTSTIAYVDNKIIFIGDKPEEFGNFYEEI